MTTPTPADAIRAAIDALRHATDEEIAATAIRTAAAELLPRQALHDRSPHADRQRLEILQFLILADELAGNTVPAESREVLADAREESQAAAIATPPRLRHCPTHGQQGPEAWGCPECVRELREELATAREALRRLVCWGGSAASRGVNSEVVLAVADWFATGMTAPLPPLPPQIASREATIEPTPSAPDLPPAITYECGDGVRISATNSERNRWVVWREIAPDRECLCIDGQWCIEPRWSFERDFAAFETRTRWPSAAAAWDALQRSRAAERTEG